MPFWKSARENFSLVRVEIVVVLTPTKEQRVDAEFVLEQADDGDRPPSRMKTGALPKPASTAADGRANAGAVDADQDGRRTVMNNGLIGDTLRADRFEVGAKLFGHRFRILAGDKAKTELGSSLARQDRLGSGALIAAIDPVHVAGRSGPFPLQRCVACLLRGTRLNASPGTPASENGSLANSARSQSSKGLTGS